MKGADRREELVRSYRWVNEFLQQIQIKERGREGGKKKKKQCDNQGGKPIGKELAQGAVGIQLKMSSHYKQIASVLFILFFSKPLKNLMVIRCPSRKLFKQSVDPPFATEYSLVHGRWVLKLWDTSTSPSEGTSLA